VPEVLLIGDHQAIERWRGEEARRRTETRRPDLASQTETNTKDTPEGMSREGS